MKADNTPNMFQVILGTLLVVARLGAALAVSAVHELEAITPCAALPTAVNRTIPMFTYMPVAPTTTISLPKFTLPTENGEESAWDVESSSPSIPHYLSDGYTENAEDEDEVLHWTNAAAYTLLCYDFVIMAAFAWCWWFGYFWWWRKESEELGRRVRREERMTRRGGLEAERRTGDEMRRLGVM